MAALSASSAWLEREIVNALSREPQGGAQAAEIDVPHELQLIQMQHNRYALISDSIYSVRAYVSPSCASDVASVSGVPFFDIGGALCNGVRASLRTMPHLYRGTPDVCLVVTQLHYYGGIGTGTVGSPKDIGESIAVINALQRLPPRIRDARAPELDAARNDIIGAAQPLPHDITRILSPHHAIAIARLLGTAVVPVATPQADHNSPTAKRQRTNEGEDARRPSVRGNPILELSDAVLTPTIARNGYVGSATDCESSGSDDAFEELPPTPHAPADAVKLPQHAAPTPPLGVAEVDGDCGTVAESNNSVPAVAYGTSVHSPQGLKARSPLQSATTPKNPAMCAEPLGLRSAAVVTSDTSGCVVTGSLPGSMKEIVVIEPQPLVCVMKTPVAPTTVTPSVQADSTSTSGKMSIPTPHASGTSSSSGHSSSFADAQQAVLPATYHDTRGNIDLPADDAGVVSTYMPRSSDPSLSSARGDDGARRRVIDTPYGHGVQMGALLDGGNAAYVVFQSLRKPPGIPSTSAVPLRDTVDRNLPFSVRFASAPEVSEACGSLDSDACVAVSCLSSPVAAAQATIAAAELRAASLSSPPGVPQDTIPHPGAPPFESAPTDCRSGVNGTDHESRHIVNNEDSSGEDDVDDFPAQAAETQAVPGFGLTPAPTRRRHALETTNSPAEASRRNDTTAVTPASAPHTTPWHMDVVGGFSDDAIDVAKVRSFTDAAGLTSVGQARQRAEYAFTQVPLENSYSPSSPVDASLAPHIAQDDGERDDASKEQYPAVSSGGADGGSSGHGAKGDTPVSVQFAARQDSQATSDTTMPVKTSNVASPASASASQQRAQSSVNASSSQHAHDSASDSPHEPAVLAPRRSG